VFFEHTPLMPGKGWHSESLESRRERVPVA
jgi:hypothetical protein